MTQIKMLARTMVEFYEKIYSWEVALVREKGFTISQIHTLEVLGMHGTMQMKELASKLGITTGTLTTQVNKLVNRGFIKRKPHDLDRRSTLVELTDVGQEIYEEHRLLHVSLVESVSDELSLAERSHLLICLKKINSRIEEVKKERAKIEGVTS